MEKPYLLTCAYEYIVLGHGRIVTWVVLVDFFGWGSIFTLILSVQQIVRTPNPRFVFRLSVNLNCNIKLIKSFHFLRFFFHTPFDTYSKISLILVNLNIIKVWLQNFFNSSNLNIIKVWFKFIFLYLFIYLILLFILELHFEDLPF